MESLARAANRGSVSTGYDIDYSLKFEPDNTEYMRRSTGTDGNQRVFTQSMWIKRTELEYSYATFWCVGNVALRFDSSDRLEVWCYTYDGTGAGTSNTDSYRIYTAEKFQDTSAWYHVVFALDTTQGTESNRLKVYVNNKRVYHDPNAGNDIYDQTITQNSYTRCNGTGNSSENWNQIGWFYTGNYVFAGYIAEVNFVDGLQLSPTDVAEYDEDSGIWKPKEYTGAYGTNGYYLKFDDASDLGKDSSGNDNDMNSIGNIAAADQATDTPTNNFCIGNALVNYQGLDGGGQTLSEGSTKFTNPSGQNWQSITGTFGLTSGKWYWEFKTNGTGAFVGISDVQDDIIPQRTDGYFVGHNDDNSSTTNSLGMYSTNGVIYNDAGSVAGASYSSSNIVGVALDMDNRKIHFAVDNTWAGSSDPANNTNGATWNTSWSDTVHPVFSCAQNNNVEVNYGGFTNISISSAASDANGYGTFEYAPPSGYYALCTKNLAEYGG